MHTTTAITVQRGAGSGRLLRPLAVLAAVAALALAMDADAAPARTTYRIIQLSPTTGNADINARGQVAFTEFVGGEPRARFFDGRVVQDMGTLGGPSAFVAALNDAGQVTGTSETRSAGISHAFRWSKPTGMIDLAAPGTGISAGADINSKGWVAGTAQFSSGVFDAFRWTPRTGMVDLGSLATGSNGFALNDPGTVVGTSDSVEGPLDNLPVRWPATTPLPLTTFASRFAAAWDINNAGQIVGNASFDGTTSGAFLWSAGTGLVDLGVRGGLVPTAEQINEKGLVIGNVYTPGADRGFVWTRETGPIIFGTLEVDITNTADLNKHGQVVGGFNGRAYVWTRAEGIVDLNTRIPGAPPGLELNQGVAISDNGSIVAAGSTGLVLLVPRGAHHGEAPVAGPVKVSGKPHVNALLSFSAAFTDADLRDTHKATWDWGDGSSSAATVSSSNGAGSASGQHAWRKAGTYTVRLTIVDSGGRRTTISRTVVICASGAAIVGEGSFMSPAGAYKAGAARSSLASFAFASDAKGTGQALVRFSVGSLAFRGNRIESVSLDGARIELRGTGTVNGASGYRFLLTADAGTKSGDRFRIRISHTEPGTKAEVVEYDNEGAGSVAASGSIVVESE